MAKIKIDSALYDRAKKVSEQAGYTSVEEFIVTMIEKELALLESSDEDSVNDQLRGLGYIE